MTTLHLLRHAKSSWDDRSLPDEQRPLAPRGRRAAEALCAHFATIGLEVDAVFCSPARRARETWERVRPGVRGEPEVRIEPAVYEATAVDLLGLLQHLDASVGSLLMVGHNPGFDELANGLAGTGAAEALAGLRAGYPTGAFATLTFDATWPDLAWRSGRLTAFVRPRELPA